MIIFLKNKQTLIVDDFKFKCCIGKKGITLNKIEGDKKTPRGTFEIGNLYYRKKKVNPLSYLHKTEINQNMGWCDDISNKKKYNRLIKINKEKTHHEKLYRKDDKYDLLIPIKYNYKKTKLKKGSCIFIHLTKNYAATAGCVALQKKDFLIMLKLIDKKNTIKIF